MDFLTLEKLWDNVQKPARYTGGEMGSVVKNKADISVRFAFCFPDLYEIGMSHLGMKILYSLYNERPDTWCERVFAPDVDMQRLMREQGVPLYGLESLDPIRDFDFIGFTLQYEMSYTGILNMLDLAGVPVHSKDRTGLSPLVIGGGPCSCNPEPLVDFFDLFILGEGEEVNIELLELYKTAKEEQWGKTEFLEHAAQIEGIYVPQFYEVTYQENGTVATITPTHGAPAQVRKRFVADLDTVYYPEEFVVPYIKTVHDRGMVEVLRGCLRGCRFCQAGFTYRPYREKNAAVLAKNSRVLIDHTGYDELSLVSLSTSDHTGLTPLLEELLPWTEPENVAISLPSLRIDAISPKLLEQIATTRKSSLTFAPEAGTQRLRDVINKNITEQDVIKTCKQAFEQGYTAVKLYFMMGLPTETMEDIAGIAELAQKVVDLFYSLPTKPKGKGVNVTISASCFVPKPFTPFQFVPQDTMEQFREKQKYLKSCIRSKKISYHYHDSPTSVIEAVLARGDRRLAPVIYRAWKKGSFLDSWSEHFHLAYWEQALEEEGLSAAFYANRRRSYEEVLPWSHLDYAVAHSFFVRENEKAHKVETTPHCREQCSGCGAASLYPKGEAKPPCR